MKSSAKNYQEEYPVIGGVPQYLLHLPGKPQAPVVLFLHGGPGSPESNFAHLFQQWWDGCFTMVFWDQRFAGKTLHINRKTANAPTIQEMMRDISEIIVHLKKHYSLSKIALMGHSWGTVLGSMYALLHPANIAFYIGVGQLVSMQENERYGYQMLQARICEAGNRHDMQKLQQLGPYPLQHVSPKMIKTTQAVRKMQAKYGVVMQLGWPVVRAFLTSPTFQLSDLSLFSRKASMRNLRLLDFLLRYDVRSYEPTYSIPVYYVLGENDYQTVTPLAKQYFDTINAPDKQLFLIPNAGHNTMMDQPVLFADAMQSIGRRIAALDK